MLMRHFGHGVGHLQYEWLNEIETEMPTREESDDDDQDSDIVAREDAQEVNIAIDVEEESLEDWESDREKGIDGYDSEAEITGDSNNGDSDDAGYTSF